MTCPDENLIASFMSGSLPPGERREVETHVDRCASCSSLIAELARLASVRPGAAGHTIAMQPEPRAAFEHPTHIGRYVVERLLGVGAWGAVYQSYDPTLARRVAIKVVRADRGAQKNADAQNASLLREAQAMAQLAHPNIVPIFEVGLFRSQGDDNCVFLVMELVTGGTLRTFLSRSPPPSEIVRMFLTIAEALAVAHDAGILHRDFKPENVLIGADGRPRIADFGLALVAMRERGRGSDVVGTPAYAAPEQLFGHAVDGRADQFAFAVSLYEALSGRFPWTLGSIEQLRWSYATIRARPLPPCKDVPAGVGPLLDQALSLEPQRRHPNMRILAAALDAATSADDLLHVRLNAGVQIAAIPLHVLMIAGMTSKLAEKPKPPDDSALASASASASASTTSKATKSEERSTSSDLGPGEVILGGGFIFVATLLLAWLYVGLVWAPINAWALLTRRRVGRVSTLIYAGIAATTCIGLPYTVYAVWSLTRPGIKAMFSRNHAS